ncbi:MAG: response regulator, partial [Anaerolinea sp.]|nr:response regulator [Anaerolinea sp.]
MDYHNTEPVERPKPLILLVDDETSITTMLSSFLDLTGFHVLTANNAMEALDRLAHTPVDLIVLDVLMPGINGRELLR